ncbi:MAG: YihA family ribosome biogenesis GTP-binding protein [Candidatus Mcinerneyibacterium aminivorans]|uniref:Probable GTP-binding protein EngB n=1 Tax=Candidatus Mcinerneyibacterium aminivorans TaxID=2703815 RepID=A0A5D0MEB7_9BACT|nr:MAG: YihA family ribosome biogenesis GTP-binding protein [Candidatus Mcinerneyibacterium aminivorans]
MRIKKIEHAGSYNGYDELPDTGLPEIVIAGRSNVGKSSFINAITRKKSLVETSKKPGKTRQINYFKINNDFVLVDLPGYGYAKRSKKEIERWKKIINEYFYYSENICVVILLIDSKVGITDLDDSLMGYLGSMGHPVYLIATKADKLNQSQKVKRKREIEKIFKKDEYHFFSSLKRKGIKKTFKLFNNVLN